MEYLPGFPYQPVGYNTSVRRQRLYNTHYTMTCSVHCALTFWDVPLFFWFLGYLPKIPSRFAFLFQNNVKWTSTYSQPHNTVLSPETTGVPLVICGLSRTHYIYCVIFR